eukprot:TRINITY_DN411_c0_g1_i1.p1 TRINITY_DN411_c0_g1~~TRINITY_DN411_c0_g1_i1.p1  ORF type:complete len:153 (-),score=37.96 TRINITY_DN411_c0_g1_i1:386-844(-)
MASEGAWFATKVLSTFRQHPLGTIGTLVAAGFRLIPHTWNMTPTATMCMFAGARLGKFNAAAAVLLCLFSLIISDLFIGVIDLSAPWNSSHAYVAFGTWTPFSYFSFFLDGLLGLYLLSQTNNIVPVAATSFVASTQFFLISNFGVWVTSDT